MIVAFFIKNHRLYRLHPYSRFQVFVFPRKLLCSLSPPFPFNDSLNLSYKVYGNLCRVTHLSSGPILVGRPRMVKVTTEEKKEVSDNDSWNWIAVRGISPETNSGESGVLEGPSSRLRVRQQDREVRDRVQHPRGTMRPVGPGEKWVRR